MPKVITVRLIVPALFLVAVSVLGAVSQKPVHEERREPDFIVPPATLNETWLDTALIIRGRVLGTVPMDKPVGNRGVLVRTGHRMKVDEVFRAPQGLVLDEREIIVLQSAGDRDRGSYIERVMMEGFPLLRPGKEYVLFLARAEAGAWGSAYGPDGVFENSNGEVLPFGKSQTSMNQRGLPWEEFLRSLRNFGIR